MPRPKKQMPDWARPQRKQRTELLPGQDEFLEWLVDPNPIPSTMKAWAEQHGVVYSTVVRWKADPIFRQAWDKRLRELNITPDRIMRVVDAMFKKAEDGDSRAAQLVMQYVEKAMPKPIADDDEFPVSELSDEELARRLMEA